MTELTHQRLWPRRRLLGAGAALALAGGPLKAMAATSHRQERSLSFHNLHTGESLARPYRVGDTYISSSLAEFDRLLRDFRTGESGYRSPKTNAQLASKSGGVAKKSLHMKGMAIDVRLPHQDLDKLRQAAIGLRLGGVGYYPGSDFVHLDTGRVRFW
jgi:uncharacterized protein YcbK (DUF882 family)